MHKRGERRESSSYDALSTRQRTRCVAHAPVVSLRSLLLGVVVAEGPEPALLLAVNIKEGVPCLSLLVEADALVLRRLLASHEKQQPGERESRVWGCMPGFVGVRGRPTPQSRATCALQKSEEENCATPQARRGCETSGPSRGPAWTSPAVQIRRLRISRASVAFVIHGC